MAGVSRCRGCPPELVTRNGITSPRNGSTCSVQARIARRNWATLGLDGSIVLTFKSATGGGARYLVQRQTTTIDNVTSGYAFMGFHGLPWASMGFADDEKECTDNAVPEGLKSVGYRVAARLSTGLMSGWSVTYTVPFGSQTQNPAGSIQPQKAKDQKSAG